MSTSSAGIRTSASSTPCAVSASNLSRSACMPQLIKGRALVTDRWTLLRGAGSLADVPAEEPAGLADDVAALPLIAIDFPEFTDGRGYSIGRLLRDRYGFKGELRAIGDVLRDQLFALSECGF